MGGVMTAPAAEHPSPHAGAQHPRELIFTATHKVTEFPRAAEFELHGSTQVQIFFNKYCNCVFSYDSFFPLLYYKNTI